MARHLVAVLISGQPAIRKLFFEAFAIMEAAGLKPVSFDRGFRDYKGVAAVVLEP